MKRIYLLNIVAWYYRKKIGFPVCKKENFAGLEAEERSARFIAQPLSALFVTKQGHRQPLLFKGLGSVSRKSR